MELYAIHTGIVRTQDDLAKTILEALSRERLVMQDKDILAITSKVISVSEGKVVDLKNVAFSKRAQDLSKEYCMQPEMCELILREADTIIGGMDGVILTLKSNTLIANAGIDKKNAGPGRVVLHPSDSSKAAEQIRRKILQLTGKTVGIIITDSRTQPLRIGTIGIALATSGFEPVVDERGKPDLFSRPLRITRRALADQLATAAEILMGETTECVPAVLIRNAPAEFIDKTISASDLTVPPNECFYTKILSRLNVRTRKRSKVKKSRKE